jgi:DNA (cytosine-5)-methyltransferase 1
LKDSTDDTLYDGCGLLSDENQKRIDYLFKYDKHDLPSKLRPRCHKGDHGYKSMYGRLWADRPAQTITTGFRSPGQGRYVHYSRKRTLTPHEAARLQCFPDFFDFSSATTKSSLSTMIGNAVPMPLAYVFAMEMLAREKIDG